MFLPVKKYTIRIIEINERINENKYFKISLITFRYSRMNAMHIIIKKSSKVNKNK
jgi:hypothetical protein